MARRHPWCRRFERIRMSESPSALPIVSNLPGVLGFGDTLADALIAAAVLVTRVPFAAAT
jgi:hypothetical protein